MISAREVSAVNANILGFGYRSISIFSLVRLFLVKSGNKNSTRRII